MNIDRPAQPGKPPPRSRQDSPTHPGPVPDASAAEASPDAQSPHDGDGNDPPEPASHGEYVPV